MSNKQMVKNETSETVRIEIKTIVTIKRTETDGTKKKPLAVAPTTASGKWLAVANLTP